MHKSNKSFWSTISSDYDHLVGEEGDINHRLVINPIVFELLGDLKSKTVLDAACGNGYLSRILAKTARHVTGIDFTEEFITSAKERSGHFKNLKFTLGNLEELPFSAEAFDVVLCNMALMNMEHLPQVIHELARVLKTNGTLVVSITHPCFENSPYTYSQRDEHNKKTGRIITSYFPTGPVINPENNHLHYHYLLADYLNAFAASGLMIEKAVEPNGAEIVGDEEKDIAPAFLIMRLKKT